MIRYDKIRFWFYFTLLLKSWQRKNIKFAWYVTFPFPCHAYCIFLASVPVEGMRSWSIDGVYKWLIETCQMSEPIAAKFKEKSLDGDNLYTLNTEEMESFMRENEFDCLFGNIILNKRDLFKEEEFKRCQVSGQDANGGGEMFREKFRDFDSVVTLKDKYREGAVFPDYEARPGNLLQPVRRYIHYQTLDPKWERNGSTGQGDGPFC